jgi:hypothetical protein
MPLPPRGEPAAGAAWSRLVGFSECRNSGAGGGAGGGVKENFLQHLYTIGPFKNTRWETARPLVARTRPGWERGPSDEEAAREGGKADYGHARAVTI